MNEMCINSKGGFSAVLRLSASPPLASRLRLLAKRANHIFVLRTNMWAKTYPPPQKKDTELVSFFVGGGWWIRTTEVSDNRFTVCPLWPLGKSPLLLQELELANGVEPSTC